MGLLLHNEYLEKKYNVGFHTISVPRLCPASGMNINDFPHLVDDETFAKITAIIRIAVPFTGMILSTRESHEMRKKLLNLGISQISAGSTTDVGGYAKRRQNEKSTSQFIVNDDRSAVSIISQLIDDGYIPSFCTACYRSGRTGDRFMSLAKSGQIGNVCLPNALMTLCEYSMDYGDEIFKEKSRAIIEKEISNIGNETIRKKTIENIEKIRTGSQRDFYI
jgi:2-iminoacetate synthase